MRIERVVDAAAVEVGSQLFDESPRAPATEQFLGTAGHHLLFAYTMMATSALGLWSG